MASTWAVPGLFSIDFCFHSILFHVTQLLQLLVSVTEWQRLKHFSSPIIFQFLIAKP